MPRTRIQLTALALERLAGEFLSGELPQVEWTHTAHLSIGAWHVHRFALDEAIERLRVGIAKLNDRHGTPNTATSGYHETITVAYARLIQDFLVTFEPSAPLYQRVNQLVAGPLSERSFLLRFWSRGLLMSEAARVAWAEPDIAPLALPLDAVSR